MNVLAYWGKMYGEADLESSLGSHYASTREHPLDCALPRRLTSPNYGSGYSLPPLRHRNVVGSVSGYSLPPPCHPPSRPYYASV